MKFTIAVIVLCALQNSLVLGRTPDEVIEDFRPLILELHNILGKETFNLGNEVGQEYISEFEKAVDILNHNMNIGMDFAQQYIEQQVEQIVAETNMTSHEDQIQHCFAQKDAGKTKLLQATLAGREVCLHLVGKDIDNLRTILNDYKDTQYSMHNALEDSVRTCKGNSTNGLDMGSCLVEHIIVQVAPQVGQTLKDMKTNMSDMSSTVAEKLNTAFSCLNFVGEKSGTIMNDVIDGFQECCVTASQNN